MDLLLQILKLNIFFSQAKFFLASETVQRHVTEFVHRDAREMETLIQSSQNLSTDDTFNVILNIARLSDDWFLFDERVIIVSFFMEH